MGWWFSQNEHLTSGVWPPGTQIPCLLVSIHALPTSQTLRQGTETTLTDIHIVHNTGEADDRRRRKGDKVEYNTEGEREREGRAMATCTMFEWKVEE
ncbi:hypothetical protein Mapa_006516 [Marchantia paleacea]|nr:hypothetical protein Mapa_006516 [Marchantia paleacea]